MGKHNTEDRPVVLVGGPTASGKSALALDLAEALDGVVVNADSMQVYRDLAVVTARPGLDDLARAPHRLYGTVDGSERCSAARWREMAVAEIDAAHADGRLPIVAGGTGLYLRALTDGLSDIPDVPEAVRTETMARHAEMGGAEFHAALAERDPVMAGRLNPGDSQRLIRAWEVLEATDRSALGSGGPKHGVRADAGLIGLKRLAAHAAPRTSSTAACDGRFEAMMAAGALEEVRDAPGTTRLGDPTRPILKALGVPELARHFWRARSSADTARRSQAAAGRHPALRQAPN